MWFMRIVVAQHDRLLQLTGHAEGHVRVMSLASWTVAGLKQGREAKRA
jgi:hypothetical protein